MLIRAMRYLGAIALLGVGAVHLQQYIGQNYQKIPTIGPLFLLNAVGSGVVGILLLLPIQRALRRRAGDAAITLLATAGVAIAAGSLAALFISETSSLFGFSETGYRTAIVLAIVSEAATILLLTPVAAVSLRRAASPQTPSRHPSTPDRSPPLSRPSPPG
ncbi:MAG TPA: hypothetical protein VGL78_03895 [Solirubrobacteraceae bacterium]